MLKHLMLKDTMYVPTLVGYCRYLYWCAYSY